MTLSLKTLATAAALLLTLASAQAAPLPDHWVGTWATADVDRPNQDRPNQDRPNAESRFGTEDTTLRQIVHVSLGGSLIRVELSNEFGTEPLTISAAHIAAADKGDDLQLLTANALTFSGRPSVTIPSGATVLSDPAGLTLPAMSDLAISLFLPAQKISHLTVHNSAYQTNYMVPGNLVGQKSLPATAKHFASWFFLKAVDVQASASASAVVAFGDSITDGTASTPDTNGRWPDILARRLQSDKRTKELSVLNLGIGGNRVLHDNTGPNALARFDTDVLAQSGVKYLIILEAINDIGHAADLINPYDPVSADDLIAGLSQLVQRAHTHGIQVFGATLTPYVGAKYASPAGEAIRQAVNTFIRTGKVFDGVIDFDAATRDSANPGAFNPTYDHGDHLHPNDAGLKAMGEAVDLKLFAEKKEKK